MGKHRPNPLVVAICGSRRDDSVTRQALSQALSTAADAGVRTELLDLREYDLPMLDPDADPPEDARRLDERLAAADAVLLGTPMYNGSYASPLKTAIDYSDTERFEDLPEATADRLTDLGEALVADASQPPARGCQVGAPADD